MIRYHTQNSVYEVDEKSGKVRRLSGKNDPTPSFGDEGGDGKWLPYKDWGTYFDGLIFVWDDDKFTTTSRVERVEAWGNGKSITASRVEPGVVS